MNQLGLFSQIAAVILAIVIGVFYVQPTIDEIGIIQTDTERYQVERKKIESINNQLATNVAAFESISRADKERLATYMPRFVDDIGVMRDLTFMIEQAGLSNTGLSYDGEYIAERTVFTEDSSQASALGDQAPTPHSVTVSVRGGYDQIKNFLRLLEQNEYPLEVHKLDIAADEFGLIDAQMTLITYADELALLNGNQ